MPVRASSNSTERTAAIASSPTGKSTHTYHGNFTVGMGGGAAVFTGCVPPELPPPVEDEPPDDDGFEPPPTGPPKPPVEPPPPPMAGPPPMFVPPPGGGGGGGGGCEDGGGGGGADELVTGDGVGDVVTWYVRFTTVRPLVSSYSFTAAVLESSCEGILRLTCQLCWSGLFGSTFGTRTTPWFVRKGLIAHLAARLVRSHFHVGGTALMLWVERTHLLCTNFGRFL